MATYRDPELDSHQSSSTMTTLPTKDESGLEKEQQTHEHSSPSTSIRHSHETDSAASEHLAPLSPLELAATLNQDAAAEYMPTTYITRTGTTIGASGGRPPEFEVDFEPNDPQNPRNWPLWYRSLVIAAVSYGTWVVVCYSTSYTSGMPGMMIEFGVENQSVATLGVTAYLFGLASGAVIVAPLSEIYGRRPVYIISLICFTILVVPCALASSLAEIIVVRYFGALFASAMVSNSPGTVSDVVEDAYRALAFSIWSIGPINAPVTGPIIGGFVYEYLGWRWTNWVILIMGGVATLFVSLMHETYAPVILKKKTAAKRAETGDDRYWCRYDLNLSFWPILRVNLSRPFVLTVTEPILWFWDFYMAIIYAILYLCFVAYPFIFTGIRGWSPGFTGLAFCGIGLGSVIIIVLEPLIRRMINAHAIDPETGKVPPEASVSIVCIAAILVPVGQLVFSWTSTPVTIHWIWSILAGVPFGAGNALVFIYASNYVAGSYGIYAASALAGSTVVRSTIGGVLPLAGPSMYTALGPRWAGTILGLLEVILIPIPFVFYKWGKKIRERSPLIRKLREDQERIERRGRRRERRAEEAAVSVVQDAGAEKV